MTPSSTLLATQALGLATGAALCAMLGAMQWRTATRNNVSRAQHWLWISGFFWTFGSFVQHVLLLAGFAKGSSEVLAAETIAWTATCWGPLIVSRLLDEQLPPTRLQRALLNVAMGSSLALALSWPIVLMTLPWEIGVERWPRASFYVFLCNVALYAYAFWASGIRSPAGISGRAGWFVYLGGAIAFGQIASMFAAINLSPDNPLLRMLVLSISQQWVVPWAIFIGTLLADIHYADVVLKRSLQLVLSIALAALIAWLLPGVEPGLPFVVTTLALAALLIAAPLLRSFVRWTIDRALLRRPEYVSLAETFANECRLLGSSNDVFESAARCIEGALRLKAWFVEASALRDPGAVARLPVRTHGSATHALELRPTSQARSLMQEEMLFIERIVSEVSRRLESLEHERERRELQLREERLRGSLTEAELKALRAQVDPHFLFNTLNTIAELIEHNPAQAELMTERLAECFRYTLSRQDKALSTLDEELRFVRQYLDIEQARFGERLRVELAEAGEFSAAMVPTLILQPLIENAVRHGVAPKPEGGRISVSARREGDCLHLQIVDDGVGMQHVTDKRSHGIGLQNVRERLQALYCERAQLHIAPGALGVGTCITLLVPLHVH